MKHVSLFFDIWYRLLRFEIWDLRRSSTNMRHAKLSHWKTRKEISFFLEAKGRKKEKNSYSVVIFSVSDFSSLSLSFFLGWKFHRIDKTMTTTTTRVKKKDWKSNRKRIKNQFYFHSFLFIWFLIYVHGLRSLNAWIRNALIALRFFLIFFSLSNRRLFFLCVFSSYQIYLEEIILFYEF
jgi:hypothetical protein